MKCGWRGMNGTQRRIALGFLGTFLLIVALIMVANAESQLADFKADGVHVRPDLVWSWEWTSMIGWLSVYPLLWIAVQRIRPPRVPWGMVAVAIVLGSVLVSAWHIGAMTILRRLYYDAVGQGPYRFFYGIENPILYEFRKDVPTYLQFLGLAALAQWLIARAATVEVHAAAPSTLSVSDGALTHLVPLGEIESIVSAGNYVEVSWQGRALLHRTSLSAIEAELGEPFLRIHRGRLVRRAGDASDSDRQVGRLHRRTGIWRHTARQPSIPTIGPMTIMGMGRQLPQRRPRANPCGAVDAWHYDQQEPAAEFKRCG